MPNKFISVLILSIFLTGCGGGDASPVVVTTPDTPVPDTPAPDTPAPDTPTPDTPAPDTPAPDTPAPDTPVPDTPAPDTPAPDTPVPDTPVPDTPVPDTPVPDTPVPDTPVPDTPSDLVYDQPQQVARLLTQATFGPKLSEINALTNQSVSEWFLDQLSLEPSYLMPVLAQFSAMYQQQEQLGLFEMEAATVGFWRNAIMADDQLRQRIAFALSELLVVSNGGGETLTDIPTAVIYFQDLLIEHAFGNYRELLEEVTYSPAMGVYLTYMGSEKGDPATGRMPDENYARELLQLFSIGVVELNLDGTPRLDGQGKTIETYSNQDITGLARVFTGLNLNEVVIEQSVAEAFATPMVAFAESHSNKSKSFLGHTIAANTPAVASINQALDHIFAHPNVAPLVATHLIKRLVSSNPSPQYVSRVATAFEQGVFALPNGDTVGEERRGDLAATVAAVLFDSEARTLADSHGGKVREPILRFSHWARAFEIEHVTVEFQQMLWESGHPTSLGQHPYRPPSVFNFFRPGYVAPGTLSGEAGLTAPELQIVNASAVAGYTNFISYFIFNHSQDIDLELVEAFVAEQGLSLEPADARKSFVASYEQELAINDDEALVEHLNLLLTHGTLSAATRAHFLSVLAELPAQDQQEKLYKIQMAVLMFMTSPDHLVQL